MVIGIGSRLQGKVAMDFDGVLSFATPWFPRPQVRSELHCYLAKYLGPDHCYVFTARKASWKRYARVAVDNWISPDMAVSCSKDSDVEVFIDDRNVGGLPPILTILKDLDANLPYFSTKGFLSYLSQEGWHILDSCDSHLRFVRAVGEVKEYIVPCYNQYLRIVIPEQKRFDKVHMSLVWSRRVFVVDTGIGLDLVDYDRGNRRPLKEAGLCLMDVLPKEVIRTWRIMPKKDSIVAGVNKSPAIPYQILTTQEDITDDLTAEYSKIERMCLRG